MSQTPLLRSGQASFVCPITDTAEAVTRLGKDMARLIRQLRRDLTACKHCPCQGDCDLQRQFHNQINEAVLAINEEWNLSV